MSRSRFTNRILHDDTRASAEIELVLMMPLIIVLLFLLINIKRLHDDRQGVHARAIANAWHDAAENSMSFDRDFESPLALQLQVKLRPAYAPAANLSTTVLPSDVAVGRESKTNVFRWGSRTESGGSVRETSAVITPAWTYINNGSPASPSNRQIRSWYTRLGQYANAGMQNRLRLAGD